jgi:hypothetical protein
VDSPSSGTVCRQPRVGCRPTSRCSGSGRRRGIGVESQRRLGGAQTAERQSVRPTKTMTPHRTCIVAILCVLGACATSTPPSKQSVDRRLPNQETQKVAFDLVQVALICIKFNQPVRPGKVVLVGAFTTPGASMEIFDSESTPGNERAISCAIEQSRRVKSPPSPPSRFIRYFLYFPGSAKDIRFDFPDVEPTRKSP